MVDTKVVISNILMFFGCVCILKAYRVEADHGRTHLVGRKGWIILGTMFVLSGLGLLLSRFKKNKVKHANLLIATNATVGFLTLSLMLMSIFHVPEDPFLTIATGMSALVVVITSNATYYSQN